jgi:hypothetical protein
VKPGEGVEHTPVTRSPRTSHRHQGDGRSGLGAKKVLLSFSADGADDFVEREMKEDPPGSGFWVAEIPASATQGAVVNYYIEAYGEGDKLLGPRDGSADAEDRDDWAVAWASRRSREGGGDLRRRRASSSGSAWAAASGGRRATAR